MKVHLAFMALVTMFSLHAFAAVDATGTWQWKYKNREGQEHTATLKLKQEGEKLTGSYVAHEGAEDAISEGKIDAEGKLSFIVTRQVRGEPMRFEYSGTLKGDTITGSILFGKPKPTPHEWEAGRVKAEK